MSVIFGDKVGDEPKVTIDILRYLESIYPLSLFKNVVSEADLHRLKGHQEVIDHLRALHDSQQ